jgi:ribulose-5-phosphate 4-epimerase/fuculose-1-phosphate aldolase
MLDVFTVDDIRRTCPQDCGVEEWRLRLELAACYRVFDRRGWAEEIFNHITVRLSGDERHYLINPFGLHYGEVTARNLVKVDLAGNAVGRAEHPVNRAGFVIHSAIHRVRDDAHCIMHTHHSAGVAVACKAEGLAMDNFYAALLHGRVAYHEPNRPGWSSISATRPACCCATTACWSPSATSPRPSTGSTCCSAPAKSRC